ncbi:MAG: cytidine deaminase [Candidatus Cloacimonadota bacterium]|nr:MAG: cytidine deaminase [Candidatus Cloacimonadota bacterium]
MTDKELLEKAKKAREYAYAPYSKFFVGAAILTKSGKVYTGCNVENSSYGLTVCAERIALFKGVSVGEKEFLKLAVIGPENVPFSPCGACRQVLFEFSPDLTIITLYNNEIRSSSLKELLPEGFSLTHLRL